jgi:hypothetical protein
MFIAFLISIIMICWGIFLLVNPEQGWYWTKGWQFKDAEPSDDALLWMRIGGVISIVAGIVLIVIKLGFIK